ncbi:MAG: TolC family protein [Leptolyngbya sp. PLA3]|nr:MAG: TolC family protein [Cyanobacteria bacterium CYA]MCE7968153.1 TolC family protein [Leptolyngbya sp. PL-A3]
MRSTRIRARSTTFAALTIALLAGCTGTPTASERQARTDLDAVGSMYRPGGVRPDLPSLTAQSPLADYLRYAILNNPRVEAAYYAWAAAVERITPARSMPDPRLTFGADITNMLEALMPGLMVDLPGPGKLRAAGDVAAAESSAGYFDFEFEVLQTAFAVKSAYVRLHFLERTLQVERETLALLADVETQARQQVGAGRGTVQDVLRAQIDREQLENTIANIDDSRSVIEAEFRAALGHSPSDLSIPLPATFEPSPAPPPADEVLAIAAAHNPRLGRMESDVRRGEAMLDLARTSRVPDLSVGIEADVKASPVMWRPTASMTLPIWRDKIAAEIAAAQADKRSAEARLTAEQIALAAEFASMLYLYREGGRNATLFENALLPRARQSLDAARSGYTTGRSSFLDLINAQRQLLEFELAAVEARTQQELSIASISLLIAGAAPEGTPLLPTAPLTSGLPDPKEDRP